MKFYNGGKGGSGVYQKIISLMPKHEIYVEGFLGSGRILRNKKPASINYGIEIDKSVISSFYSEFNHIKNLHLRNESFFDFISFNFKGHLVNKIWSQNIRASETLIYCDPPYLKSVRSSKNRIYNYEMMEDHEHENLLIKLNCLPCKVMISGYESDLYNKFLSDWRKVSFNTTNRAGKRTTEIVWMNFPEPLELHDYTYLGNNFRERERIKRKRQRWREKLLKMDAHEKFALMATIEELKTPSATSPEMMVIEHR